MARFGYLHHDQHFSIKESFSKIADELLQFWEKYEMPTRRKDKVLLLLNNYFKQYDTLRKSSYNFQKRLSFTEKMKEF